MRTAIHRNALVLFSGGQDSTTCLAHALAQYERVETLAFDYRQRHLVELTSRVEVLAQIRASFPQWADKLGEDHLLDLGVLGQVSETSLTRDMAFQMEQSGLPNTFVPGRNLLFLTLAVEHTHTCYLGDREHRHAWGFGCGTCPACDLRAKGWLRWRR